MDALNKITEDMVKAVYIILMTRLHMLIVELKVSIKFKVTVRSYGFITCAVH